MEILKFLIHFSYFLFTSISFKRQFADNIDKKSVGIEREQDSIKHQSTSNLKSPKPATAWISLPTLLVIVCVALLVTMMVLVQMSYWPANALKSHSYRRVNTQDDEEDKMFGVKIDLEPQNEPGPNEMTINETNSRGSQII